MIRKIVKFLLIIICMITIFSFSTDSGSESTKKSDSIIIKSCEKILGRKLSDSEKEKYIDKYVFLVRKSAHFTIYCLLGFFIISFLKEFMIIDKKAIIITVIVVFLYACSDEVHQLFVDGRSGEVFDVLIDTFGGFIASILYYLKEYR